MENSIDIQCMMETGYILSAFDKNIRDTLRMHVMISSIENYSIRSVRRKINSHRYLK